MSVRGAMTYTAHRCQRRSLQSALDRGRQQDAPYQRKTLLNAAGVLRHLCIVPASVRTQKNVQCPRGAGWGARGGSVREPRYSYLFNLKQVTEGADFPPLLCRPR